MRKFFIFLNSKICAFWSSRHQLPTPASRNVWKHKPMTNRCWMSCVTIGSNWIVDVTICAPGASILFNIFSKLLDVFHSCKNDNFQLILSKYCENIFDIRILRYLFLNVLSLDDIHLSPFRGSFHSSYLLSSSFSYILIWTTKHDKFLFSHRNLHVAWNFFGLNHLKRFFKIVSISLKKFDSP